MRFGGFGCEGVAAQGSERGVGQRATGYGLMIAGIDGRHVGLIAGLDAGAWAGLIEAMMGHGLMPGASIVAMPRVLLATPSAWPTPLPN